MPPASETLVTRDRFVVIRDKILALCNCDTLDDSPTEDPLVSHALLRQLDASNIPTDKLFTYAEQWAGGKGVDGDPARLLKAMLRYIPIGEHPGINVPTSTGGSDEKRRTA